MKIRDASFAIRIVRRAAGEAAVAAILETRRAIAIRITPEEIREWIDDGRM